MPDTPDIAGNPPEPIDITDDALLRAADELGIDLTINDLNNLRGYEPMPGAPEVADEYVEWSPGRGESPFTVSSNGRPIEFTPMEFRDPHVAPSLPREEAGSFFAQELPAPLSWYSVNPEERHGYIRITASHTTEDFTQGWLALAAIFAQYDINVIQYTFETYTSPTGRQVRLPDLVIVQQGGARAYGRRYSFEPVECCECQHRIAVGEPYCPSCDTMQQCDRCETWGGPVILDPAGNEGPLCGACAIPCETCGTPNEFLRCGAHAVGDRFNCVSCGRYTDDGRGATYSDYYDGTICDRCTEPDYCQRCDSERSVNDDGLCSDCAEDDHNTRARVGSDTEEFESEEKLERDMFINAIPGRENIRRCGIEIEGGGQWQTMAQRLYDNGLTSSPRMAEYHATTGGNSVANRWNLERDSSVDWELVSPPINLADRDNVRQLRGVLKIVREEIKEGSVSLDMRCGLHIHIGAERTAIGGAFNVGTVWGYLEDVFFRLGAAKWPKHRAIQNGVHYCRPTAKGAKTRLEFGLQLENQSEPRYNALSFNNYLRAMSRGCTCGAVRYDSWDQCVCDLGKCTFEFRVFNTSANMHKIHAYLALCQALVAWATALPDLDVDQYPAQTFSPKLVAEMGEVPRTQITEDWKPRLQFIFNELPLTDPEKADLLYCVRSSELAALGSEFIDSLAPNNAQEVLI